MRGSKELVKPYDRCKGPKRGGAVRVMVLGVMEAAEAGEGLGKEISRFLKHPGE